MKKRIFVPIVGAIILIVSVICSFVYMSSTKNIETKKLSAIVMYTSDNNIFLQDTNNIIYTFDKMDINAQVGEDVVIEYTGALDKNKTLQESNIVDYTISSVSYNENGIPSGYLDDGIFKDYYPLAYNDLKKLSLEEKIAQLLLVRYPDNNQKAVLEKYQFGGYVFFEKDFKDKTKEEIISMMRNLQNVSKIPILTAVDEEGGKVVRLSSNTNLRSDKFKSSSELYSLGGLDKIRDNTIEKSRFLNELGINLNLAPVVDVTTDPNAYMYSRTLGKNTDITKSYAKTVISASKDTGVSYTLKHFPGYGNNDDTHISNSTDIRSYTDILNNDIPPFKEGINVGAEAVLVSHNTVDSIDNDNPASLSASIHNLLRNELDFTGIIITDDLDMGAVNSISDVYVKAILAGNDLLITTDYEDTINEIKTAVENGTISEEIIDKLAFRILSWKYYKGLMFIEK